MKQVKKQKDRIDNAPPENGFPVGLDERIRNTVQEASAPDYLTQRIDTVLAGIAGQEETGSTRQSGDSVQKNRGSMQQSGIRRRWWRPARFAAVAAVAVVVIGGSVFAATRLIHFNINQNAAYSVDVGVSLETTADSSGQPKDHSDEAALPPSEVAGVQIDLAYMTPGMEANYKGSYTYASPDSRFGYFIFELYMDSDGTFTQDFVTDYETLSINDRTAAYLCSSVSGTDPGWLQQDLYISFPEYDRIIAIHGWGHAEKEELIKIAEGITLAGTDTKIPYDKLATFSNYQAYKNGELPGQDIVVDEPQPVQTASAEEMKNLHKIGEEFHPYVFGKNAKGRAKDVTVRVTDVQIADDLSLLSLTEGIPKDWNDLTAQDGSLQNGVTQFVKHGDGKESLNEVVATREYPVKLVYVTIEYKNNSDTDLTNVGYQGSLMGIQETDGQYHISSSVPGDVSDIDYDELVNSPLVGFNEMFYYDVRGGERNNNYIPEIKAGGSEVVHMAWIIPEQDLDKMFLNLSGTARWNGFDKMMLDVGLVDLRQ